MAQTQTPKEQFLEAYEREHVNTMRVLRAFPADKADLRPHESSRTARELAWVFAEERGFGIQVLDNVFAKGGPSGEGPAAPQSWGDLLAGLDGAHKQLAEVVAAMPDEKLYEKVKFFTGPGQLTDMPRINFLWFLLTDQIHHRGQFSVYLRMSGAKVPSIYGPSKDEPWW